MLFIWLCFNTQKYRLREGYILFSSAEGSSQFLRIDSMEKRFL
jgi:hypothetical protein